MLSRIDQLALRGENAETACRRIGLSRATHFRWKKSFGASRPDQWARLTDLESENHHLRAKIAEIETTAVGVRERETPTTLRPCARGRNLRSSPTPTRIARAPDMARWRHRAADPRSKRSSDITLVHAATKSCTNFS